MCCPVLYYAYILLVSLHCVCVYVENLKSGVLVPLFYLSPLFLSLSLTQSCNKGAYH